MSPANTSPVQPYPGEALGSLLARCAWGRGETVSQFVRSIWGKGDLMTRDIDRAINLGASQAVVALGPPVSEHVYLATGFPASRSKADPSSDRLKTILSGFRTTLAPAAARAALLTHPELQLVFSLNIDCMNFPDGTVKAIADPAGMSGSPIWLQQGDELNCTGILIEHHRSKRLLVATDIAVGLHLIETAAAR